MIAYAALQGAAYGAIIATAAISIQDLSSGNVRSEEEAEQTISVASISGALTAATAVGINSLLGLKFFTLHTKLSWGLWTFGNGAADIAAGMLTRASDAFMLEGMTEEERNAYIFSPRGILFDFTLGRVLDFVIGRPSIPSANSASKQALGEVAEEGAGQIVKEIEGEVAGQAAKEVEGEVIEQFVKEIEGETLEQATKDAIEGGLKTIDTGDLKVVQKRTPEIANNEWLTRGYDKPPYAPDFEVRVVQAGNEEYVRVFSYNSDGTSNKLGGWIMRKSDIEGLTPAQIADKYALPQEPTHICDVIVDPDFHLQAGIANKVEGWGNGGGLQFDTMGKKLPQSAFVNERIIGE